MEEVDELIERYSLEEDGEHVIIPFTGSDGRQKRCFLLKRRFLRIIYTEEHYLDIPLNAAIEATVQYPELLLSEAINITHKDLIEHKTKIIEEMLKGDDEPKEDTKNE